jgi:hypothetical protein
VIVDPKTQKDKQGTLGMNRPSLPWGKTSAFAFSYQLGWMYMRYFMWNFAGKQNDLQGVYMSNVRDGNWKTGIGFWDTPEIG